MISMTISDAQKRAIYKYTKENLKRIPLDVSKDKHAEIKKAADKCGESVNGFIKKAIDERLERLNAGA